MGTVQTRLMFTLLLVTICGCESRSPTSAVAPVRIPTIEEYTHVEIASTNAQLATGTLRPMVENIHPGVSYSGASLTSLRLTTIDGTHSAGVDGANIAEVHTVIVLRWGGPFTADGFTEVLTVYDRPAKLVKETRFLRSNAAINLAEINWRDVGATLVLLALTRRLR